MSSTHPRIIKSGEFRCVGNSVRNVYFVVGPIILLLVYFKPIVRPRKQQRIH